MVRKLVKVFVVILKFVGVFIVGKLVKVFVVIWKLVKVFIVGKIIVIRNFIKLFVFRKWIVFLYNASSCVFFSVINFVMEIIWLALCEIILFALFYALKLTSVTYCYYFYSYYHFYYLPSVYSFQRLIVIVQLKVQDFKI